jgi:Ca2+-binding RTX toxin-like protein
MRLNRLRALVAGLMAVSIFIAPPVLADDDDDDGDANIGCALRYRRGGPQRHSGTQGDDRCRGSLGRDVMKGHDGDDRLSATWAPDIVWGNRGDDLVRGGRENDLVGGGKGDDRLAGGRGNDRFVGGIGHDDICVGTGSNVVLAEDHRQDRIFGATPNDRLVLDPGDRVLERACPYRRF